MSYFANIGPPAGPILGRHRFVAIGVLERQEDRTPIGAALAVGRADDEVELWELTLRGADLPGRWIVVDRQFHPAPEAEGPDSGSRGSHGIAFDRRSGLAYQNGRGPYP